MQTARRLVKGPDTAETSKKHFAKTNPERHDFQENALTDPNKKQPQNKESIHFSRISYHLHLY